MHKKNYPIRMIFIGLSAGAINGIFGAGGGMMLVPLLTLTTDIQEDEIFPTSVSIILPISIISLLVNICNTAPDWQQSIPYLMGSIAGGIVAGFLGKRIPTKWLHRFMGILILYGGIRHIC